MSLETVCRCLLIVRTTVISIGNWNGRRNTINFEYGRIMLGTQKKCRWPFSVIAYRVNEWLPLDVVNLILSNRKFDSMASNGYFEDKSNVIFFIWSAVVTSCRVLSRCPPFQNFYFSFNRYNVELQNLSKSYYGFIVTNDLSEWAHSIHVYVGLWISFSTNENSTGWQILFDMPRLTGWQLEPDTFGFWQHVIPIAIGISGGGGGTVRKLDD